MSSVMGDLRESLRKFADCDHKTWKCMDCGCTTDISTIQSPVRTELQRLCDYLHKRFMHPDFEYDITKGPRKAWDGQPDMEQQGWQINEAAGGWDRFEYHEERYWMRKKNPAAMEILGSADR